MTVRKYNATDISVASMMEGVRSNPGMYVGDVDAAGTLQCFSEAMQNAVDEMRECGGGRVLVCVRGKRVTVADEGRGIPVDIHPKTGRSAVETVLTHVHAGGKNASKTAYGSRTFGVHGVGISAVNALSERFTAWTFRGAWWRIDLRRGAVVRELRRADPPFPWRRGTIVSYELDETILREPLSLRSVRHYCNIVRHFDPIDVSYSDDERSATLERREPKALLDKSLRADDSELILGPVDFNAGGVRAVLAWTRASDASILAHVSGAPVPVGTHVQGLEDAVREAFAAVRAKSSGDPTVGLRAVIDVSVDRPSFSGQVKTALRTPAARRAVREATLKPLSKYLKANKVAALEVLDHAAKIGAIEERSSELKKLAKAAKSTQGSLSFPKGFVGAFSYPAEKRELYICEGRSASGSAEYAKLPHQEVLPLRGKMANVVSKKGALASNEVIAGMFRCVGYDPRDPDKKLRVGRVIMLPDADDDGDHIAVLMMTVFHRAMPRLIAEGRLFLCDAPLFEATDSRGEKVLGDNLAEMKKRGGTLRDVSRMKGWGGCPVPLLRSVAFDPATRRLIRVLPPSDAESRGLSELMGADSGARKALLESDARDRSSD